MLKECFQAMKERYLVTKGLCKRLCLLERQQDHIGMQSAFTFIQRFSSSKQSSQSTQKSQTVKSLETNLSELLKKRLTEAFSLLQKNTSSHNHEQAVKRHVIQNCFHRSLRHYFIQWKHQKNTLECAEVIYEEGPARMRERQSKQEMENLKLILKDEGFTEEQISQIE